MLTYLYLITGTTFNDHKISLTKWIDFYLLLFRNQICIAVDYDSNKVYFAVEGYGKTSQKKTLAAFSSHIATGSMLINVGKKVHKVLVLRLSLIMEPKIQRR